jgi:tetratricopeptide (TPR) repeat protein
MYLRRGRSGDASTQFDRAEQLTRDADLLYLARFYRGQLLLRSKKDADAMAAFRAALKARPASQAASTALAVLLVKAERYTDAQALMKQLLDAGPNRTDQAWSMCTATIDSGHPGSSASTPPFRQSRFTTLTLPSRRRPQRRQSRKPRKRWRRSSESTSPAAAAHLHG